MKVAFLILAHKNPDQLNGVIQCLDSPSSIFFIHIDKKVDISPFKLATQKFKNIIWVDREDGRWGDIGIVKASINCLSTAVESAYEFSHYVLLSGQDYSLKNTSEIITFFNKNQNSSFIEYSPLPIKELNYSGYDRVNAYSMNFNGKRHTAIPLSWKPKFNLKGQIFNSMLLLKNVLKGKRKHPEGISPFYGSQWWGLNQYVAEEVLNFFNQRPDFLEYHKSSLLPDELVFQSIVGSIQSNFPSHQVIVNENLHFIDWQQKGNHPKTLTVHDYEKLISSGKLFARKFETPESDELIQKLDDEN